MGNGTNMDVIQANMHGKEAPRDSIVMTPEYRYARENHTANPQAIPTIGAVTTAVFVWRRQRRAKQVGMVPGLDVQESGFISITSAVFFFFFFSLFRVLDKTMKKEMAYHTMIPNM